MPISGVVITCRPGSAEALAAVLHRPDSVDIQHVVNDSTLVAVIEAPTVADEVQLTQGLMDVDGVVTVRLVYHHFEDIVS